MEKERRLPEDIVSRIMKRLSMLDYKELQELGINGQQQVRIKNGNDVVFRHKTLLRLQKHFGIK